MIIKNIPREHVLEVVKKIGPTIPVRIVKELGGDTFLIGAILSDLVNNNFLKVTNVKVGGTPFYYSPGQEEKLMELSKYLNEKDKITYDLLKEKKILKDEEQTPLVRVSLRTIKDYAIPIEITAKGEDEPTLFWKFYTLSNKDIELILREMHSKKIIKEVPVVEKIPTEDASQARENEKEVTKKPVKPEEVIQEKIEKKKESKDEKKEVKGEKKESVKEDKKGIIKEVRKKEEQILEKPKEQKQEKLEAQEKFEKEEKKEKPKQKKELKEIFEIKKETPEITKEKQKIKEAEEVMKEKQKEKDISKKPAKEDFLENVKNHFSKKGIEILDISIIRKGEVDFVIRIPSPIGTMDYFCKARDKKKITEGDLATAFIQGQQKKLSVLYMTNGELTKKAKEMLVKEFKGLVVNNI